MDLTKLIERAKNILIQPKAEWPMIEAESATTASLYKGWVLILAAVTPIVGFISVMLFGLQVPFEGNRPVPFGVGLLQMVLAYLAALTMTYVAALVIDALAPTFGGTKNRMQALKTVSFAWTPVWLSGLFSLLPGFWILGFVGIAYAIFLLYLGLPVTMKAPEDRAGGYTATVVVLAILLSVVLGTVVGYASGMTAMSRGVVTGAITDDKNEESVDHVRPDSAVAKLARTGEKVERAGKKLQQAEKAGDTAAQTKAAQEVVGALLGGGDKVESLSPDLIKPFLPATLGGLERTSVSAEKNTVFGIQVSKGEAVYRDPDGSREIRLEVTDTGGVKGAIEFAGWATTERDAEADWGYEKMYRQGARLVHEKWHKDSEHGEYGLLLAGRFAVKLDCDGLSMDEIKRIAASLDLRGLEALKDSGVTKG